MGTISRRKLQQELELIEAQLAQGSGTLTLQFERASILSKLGLTEQAKQGYLEVIQQDPTHLGALYHFASLIKYTNVNAARTAYLQAVKHHPEQPLVHVQLANLLMYANELTEAREHYEIALQLDPDNVHAHQALSLLLQNTGEDEKMQYHHRKGYASHPVTTLTYVGDTEPISLLLIISGMGWTDLPWPGLIDNSIFLPTTLMAKFYDPTQPLPEHTLIFNVIGDADACQVDLQAAEILLQHVTAPVLNPPSAILASGRMSNAERLRTLPGVITPHTILLPKESLADKGQVAALMASHRIAFPLLLRSPGFHTGQHFMYVEDWEAFGAAVSTLPGQQLMVMEYLDTRDSDGYTRKYRVMMINGQLYPLHLAISKHWKVHYVTAEMSNHAAHQQEESEFLNDMPKVLEERGMSALKSIQTSLGLDYGGIDFGINMTGDIVVFEANATMKIVPPPADPQWDYRRAAIENALSAARNMISERAGLLHD
jgi:Tetratricopeptide repeat